MANSAPHRDERETSALRSDIFCARAWALTLERSMASTVRAQVTLLPELKRGRSWSAGAYRPHLLVGDPSDRTPTPSGSALADAYLGVEFRGSKGEIAPGQSIEVELVLLYDGINYGALVPGATFTVREGPTVVGYGAVV
jgi:hypothetical protein